MKICLKRVRHVKRATVSTNTCAAICDFTLDPIEHTVHINSLFSTNKVFHLYKMFKTSKPSRGCSTIFNCFNTLSDCSFSQFPLLELGADPFLHNAFEY